MSTSSENRYNALFAAVKALRDAEARSLKRADARAVLRPGSTRARVTTANAQWARAAEERDRCQVRVANLLACYPELRG